MMELMVTSVAAGTVYISVIVAAKGLDCPSILNASAIYPPMCRNMHRNRQGPEIAGDPLNPDSPRPLYPDTPEEVAASINSEPIDAALPETPDTHV